MPRACRQGYERRQVLRCVRPAVERKCSYGRDVVTGRCYKKPRSEQDRINARASYQRRKMKRAQSAAATTMSALGRGFLARKRARQERAQRLAAAAPVAQRVLRSRTRT